MRREDDVRQLPPLHRDDVNGAIFGVLQRYNSLLASDPLLAEELHRALDRRQGINSERKAPHER